MASKYKTDHKVPEQFPAILKDFVREILREQPSNIYDYGASYFRARCKDAAPSASNVDYGQQLYELFQQADLDGNGVLDHKEFKTLLKNGQLGFTKKQVRLLLSEADENDDGVIDYREFVEIVVQIMEAVEAQRLAEAEEEEKEASVMGVAEDYFVHGLTRDELELMLRQTFSKYDRDKNGFLDRKEFKRFLRNVPFNLTRREFNVLLHMVDEDESGHVTLEEFVPIFHDTMVKVVAQEILKVQDAGPLSDAIVEAAGGQRVKKKKCRKALKDLGIGLSNFQISVLVDEAHEGDDGLVDVVSWARIAAATIDKMANLSPEQIQRRQAAAVERSAAQAESEFTVCGVPVHVLQDALYGLFVSSDADSSGFLDEAEFMRALEASDKSSTAMLTPEHKKALMDAADVDDDGKISYGEFVDLAVALLMEMEMGAYQ